MSCELKVGGMIYGGWLMLRIERGIEQMAGNFELSITEKWPGQAERRPIRNGKPCQVLIDGTPVITGYVDDRDPSYDKASHTLSIKGRDKTEDLVDCSAIYKGGQWAKGTKLSKIANDLCTPFGIKVISQTDFGAIPQGVSIQDGETVFECLERAARMKAVLLMSDGLGNLLITRASNKRTETALIEGENILKASGSFSWKDRHSKYIVHAQAADHANNWEAETHTSPSGSATDEVIDRYRPLIVLAEDQGNGITLKQRAEWERNVRIGRGKRATITVAGWKHSAGLWEPNTLVPVTSPSLDVDADLLIAHVSYILDDENGEVCELEVCMPQAFDLLSGIKSTALNNKITGSNGVASNVRKAGKNKQDWSNL